MHRARRLFIVVMESLSRLAGKWRTGAATRRSSSRAFAVAVLAAALAVVGVFGTEVGNAATAEVARPAEAPDRRDPEAARFREENGLSNDPAHRVTVAARDGSENEFGVPLSHDELRDMRFRTLVEGAVPAVINRAGREANFAGVWMDQRRGGVVVVQFADDANHEQLRRELQEILPPGAAIKISRSGSPLAQLEELHSRIDADTPQLKAEGFDIQGVGTDIPGNQVYVEILRLSDEQHAELQRRYQNDPRVRWQEIASAGDDLENKDNSPGQWKGGMRISKPGGSCSVGFGVTDQTTNTKFVLTAGHCNGGTSNGTGSLWDHNWDANNPIVRNMNSIGSNADAAAISLPSEDVSNLVILTPTDTAAIFGEVQGDFVGNHRCNAGAFTGYSCGQITDVNYTSSVGTPILNLTRATYMRSDGDSGGAVIEPKAVDPDGVHRLSAAGLHKGFACDILGTCRSFYSKIRNALRGLNATLMTSYNEFRMQAVHSAQCADVVGGSTANGTELQQFSCNANAQQGYTIRPVGGRYQIRPVHSPTQCLDVPLGTTAQVNMQTWTCAQPQPLHQLWNLSQVQGYNFHVLPSSGSGQQCLDVTGASQTNGARLQQFGCLSNFENQWWHLISR